ncbi:MAG: pili assembly chaperone [Pseudomonas sp.]|nr:pili assembly chaperone [Pseudomonas sp.]
MNGLNIIIVLTLLWSLSAQAAVSLSGTRLIFDGAFREVSIEAVNRSTHEVLLQAWLSDPAEEGEHTGALPFALTPHLSQLPALGKQVLRILYEGVGMPRERESLLHLYVMEIPRRAEGENQLSIAIRQRINVFYRPAGLPGDPADTAQALRWRLTRDATGAASLQVNNQTAYHASLQHVRLEGVELSDYLLLPPGTSQSLPLKQPLTDDQRLSFTALTDYGGQRHYRAEVNGRASSNAHWLPESAPTKDAQP